MPQTKHTSFNNMRHSHTIKQLTLKKSRYTHMQNMFVQYKSTHWQPSNVEGENLSHVDISVRPK